LSEPLVSVVIPTYNSEKTLAKCLESIRNQTYKNVEVIVVDRFSRDKTIEIAKSYGAKILQVNAERAEAKNFGLKNATGKYVLFVDSDMELTRDVIRECVDLIERDEKIGGVIIPERSVGKSFWAKVRNFERGFYVGTEVESARFFKRDLVEKVKGFDEDVVFFEESTLPQKIKKLGYNVEARITAEILHHEEDFSFSRWLKKKFYYGKSITKYRREYCDHASKQLNVPYRLLLFLKSRRFYSKPTLAIGVLILKILEYCSIKLGALTNKPRGRNIK
jgi:glycosyltransferase involved in cell wall biosynthesis